MSFQISLAQISRIINPIVVEQSVDSVAKTATGITTDTRNLLPNQVFLALGGEKFDGHNFLEVARDKGAIALITRLTSSVEILKGIPQFQVENTLLAYQQLATWWRSQLNIPVIAVTGSVGKTTTKELIAAVLSTQGHCYKTYGNYNNEIGVPKSLLEIEKQHDYAVIEMAMRAKGEIAQLTKIAAPNIGVITNVGTAHIGRLGSSMAIALAKCELLAEMSNSGVAILNQDNQLLIKTASSIWQGETVTYGLEGGDISGKLVDENTLRVEGVDLPLPLTGRHNAVNYLAAIAVAKVLGIDIKPLSQGLSINLPSGRSQSYQLPDDIILLDETYNAGLESMIAALHLLKQTSAKRRIAVLGTMKELGEHSSQLHHRVGKTVKQLDIDYLLVLIDEPETEEIALGAAGVATECFTNHEELLKKLKVLVQPGDCFLFKASNSVGLNQIVAKFREEF